MYFTGHKSKKFRLEEDLTQTFFEHQQPAVWDLT